MGKPDLAHRFPRSAMRLVPWDSQNLGLLGDTEEQRMESETNRMGTASSPGPVEKRGALACHRWPWSWLGSCALSGIVARSTERPSTGNLAVAL